MNRFYKVLVPWHAEVRAQTPHFRNEGAEAGCPAAERQ